MTDTSVEVNCGQTTASRATVLGGLAVMQAARKLRADLDVGESLADLVGATIAASSPAPTRPNWARTSRTQRRT